MDLFKKASVILATALDWNARRCVKRSKGDTKRVHKSGRRNLKHDLNNELKDYNNRD